MYILSSFIHFYNSLAVYLLSFFNIVLEDLKQNAN